MEKGDRTSAALYAVMFLVGLLGIAEGTGNGDRLVIALSFGLMATVFHASAHRWWIG